MSNKNIETPYLINYTNHLFFNGETFSFRKKELFNITNIPIHIPRTSQGWWIGRKLLTLSAAQKITVNSTIVKDISDLQWYQQEQLNHVFNLNH